MDYVGVHTPNVTNIALGPSDRQLDKKFHGSKKHVYPVLTRPSAPSVPGKFQSNGYEEYQDGRLVPQNALPIGFSGLGQDTSGPGDYDPKPMIYNQVKPSFSKSARQSVVSSPAWSGKDLTVPGPGQYNARSSFDDFRDISGRISPSKQLAIFKSVVPRQPFEKREADTRAEPGPSTYIIPSTLKVLSKPTNQQCFSSTNSRFAESVPRSLRLTTAPGSYNVSVSDFDESLKKIKRQKALVKRSDWAQNVAFISTGSRFQDPVEDGPSPASYDINKHTIHENTRIPRHGSRNRPFNTSSKRFYNPIGELDVPVDSGCASVLGNDSSSYSKPVARGISSAKLYGPPRSPKRVGTSAFADTQSRLMEMSFSDAPSVGSYNINIPSKPKGPFLPMSNTSPAPTQYPKLIVPGPGDYNINISDISNHQNRKNVLLTTTERYDFSKDQIVVKDVPGPGKYNIATSIILPSHNASLVVKLNE